MLKFITVVPFLLTSILAASEPAWWAEYSVLNSQAVADDYAAVNAGQLKNIAAKAAAYLDDELAILGGAEDIIGDTIGEFGGSDDYVAVNVGQVKALGILFYDRLSDVGIDLDPPWGPTYGTEDDYALANIGQVKNVFSFAIPIEFVPEEVDTSGDGIMDWWLYEYFGTIDVDPSAHHDGDGLTTGEEYLIGTSPVTTDSDGDGFADNSDADPNDDSILELSITISFPVEQSTIN